jgi:hypothetical protein
MTPEAYVSHQVLHRFRVRIPLKKGDSSYFSEIKGHLSECEGVENVSVNSSTGSILVLYRGEKDKISDYARENNLFDIKSFSTPKKTLFDYVSDTFRTYNENMKQMTNGQIDIPSMVFLSLLFSGIIQIARGNFSMPAWYTAFYYALGVLSHAGDSDGGVDDGE